MTSLLVWQLTAKHPTWRRLRSAASKASARCRAISSSVVVPSSSMMKLRCLRKSRGVHNQMAGEKFK